MSDLILDVGLAYKLQGAFRRNGWTRKLIDKACEGDRLGEFKQILLGHAVTTVEELIIDCDAQPFVPRSWSVEEHRKGGALKWDKEAQKNALYLDKDQLYVSGFTFRHRLASISVLNANVLDCLLANPKLIPEEWKSKHVFFWGTVYRDRNGDLCVRCLCWRNGRWSWGRRWLGFIWDGRRPAAVRAR